jgi:NADPH:quinone reductase
LIPNSVSYEEAAALMIKGMTAEMLVYDSYAVKAGDTILIQGATGGVASLVTMWANAIGARVIAVVSTQKKKEIALRNGAHEVIVSSEEVIAKKVRMITNGKGVDAVYDGVGQAAFADSIDSLKTGGTFVGYGAASGPITEGIEKTGRTDIVMKNAMSGEYIYGKMGLEKATSILFDEYEKATFKQLTIQKYPLAETAQAHRDMEGRKTYGAVILQP